MPNNYYNPSGTPGTGTFAASAPMRSEFNSIASGFDLLPALSGASGRVVVVNSGETALTTTANLRLGNGTAAAPIYSALASTGTGLYFPSTNFAGIAAGGNLGVQIRSTDATNFMEYVYSSAVIWRARNVSSSTADINAVYASNGNGDVRLSSNSGGTNSIMFRVSTTGTAGDANNYLRVTTGATGSGPTISTVAQGTGDSNIDLVLAPAGTGVLRFGTRSAITTETLSGYITVKDSAGNTRKLAVVS